MIPNRVIGNLISRNVTLTFSIVSVVQKNHKFNTHFKVPLFPRQVKGRKVPIRIQDRVAGKIKTLVKDGHIGKLDKCTTDHFIAPIVLTAEKDGSIKIDLNAKPINVQIWKNKYQMTNMNILLR